jgi:hypothetical protein
MRTNLFCTLFSHDYSDGRVVEIVGDRAEAGPAGAKLLLRTCIFCGHQKYDSVETAGATADETAVIEELRRLSVH